MSGAVFATEIVDGKTVGTVEFTIQDNGIGDNCPEVGYICDPGGPGEGAEINVLDTNIDEGENMIFTISMANTLSGDTTIDYTTTA